MEDSHLFCLFVFVVGEWVEGRKGRERKGKERRLLFEILFIVRFVFLFLFFKNWPILTSC